MENFPYKLNIAKMEARITQLPVLKKINLMMNLHSMKDDGILAVSDIVQIFQHQNIPEELWFQKLINCKNEKGLFLFSNTISLYERCGKIKISQQMREAVQLQLNRIYKLTNY